MKFDYSCARAILLALEDSIIYKEYSDSFISSNDVDLNILSKHNLLKDYKKVDIAYCSQKLQEANFIDAHIVEADDGIIDILYLSITYDGHEYLDSVRHPQLWEDIKQQFREKPVDMTFNLIQKVASKLANRYLGISLE